MCTNANNELRENRENREKEKDRVRGCLSQALALFPGGDEIRLSVMFPLVKGIQSRLRSRSRSDSERFYSTDVVLKQRVGCQVRFVTQIQI